MNANETIFALALASNDQPDVHLTACIQQLKQIGVLVCSPIYLIPCRDGIGADYWNAACLLHSALDVERLTEMLKQLEKQAGRLRPSHRISLDIDLIAWGNALSNMQFNPQKWPLALDVKIPLATLWQHPELSHTTEIEYPILDLNLAI